MENIQKNQEKMKQKTTLPKADVFKTLYYDLKDKQDDDQALFNRDISHLVPIYFQQKIREKTLINIAFRGEPGSGKSVVALQCMHTANTYIEKEFDKTIDRKNSIASDQGELLRKSKDKTTHYTCMEVDEFDPLIASGANATTEQKEYEFFSDLCRVYYLHRMSCSPTKIADPNVNVVFDVMSKDEEAQQTFVKILYRNSLEGRWVQLGVAWISVAEVLATEWFAQYMEKKQARVDLLTNHGIRGVRELEFAYVAKIITKEVSEIMHEIEDKQSVNALLRIKAINAMQDLYQRPISFIAEDEIIKPATALLGLIQAITKFMDKEGKVKREKKQVYETFALELKKSWDAINNKVQIYEKYKTIMD